MKMSQTQKDFWSAIVVGLVTMVLFVVLMGTVVVWGQHTGQKVRSRLGSGTPTGTAIVVSAAPPAAVANRVDGFNPGVPVFCHHYLRGSSGPVRFLKILGAVVLSLPLLDDTELWTQTEQMFSAELKYLYENGYKTIGLDELTEYQLGHLQIPARSVVLTFDDGDRSVYDVAYPLLERYRFKATLFVVTGHVGEHWSGVETMTWNELRELRESGVFDIQSHSHDLHYKVETPDGPAPVFLAASEGHYSFEGFNDWEQAVLVDLITSRELIRDRVGGTARYLAWPYGGGNESADSLAVRAGFHRICSLQDGANPPLTGLSTIVVRHAANRSVTSSDFETLLTGGVGTEWTERTQGNEFWQSVEIRRYTLTARTSMRTFQDYLVGDL